MKISQLFYGTMLSAVVLLSMNACQQAGMDTPTPVVVNSFDLIQDRILTPSCARSVCHLSDQDASFKQHGLVLVKGMAYNNLINKDPKNTNALKDKLKLVLPSYSLASLLYHKLIWDGSAAHHSGANYGSPMPLGGNALSKGQIEFVRRWIEAGAPQKGNVVDTTLLNDRTPSYVEAFVPLEKPKVGEGVQMVLEPFDINPNFEREIFKRKEVGNAADLYVNRVVIKMRANSHHFILQGFRDLTPTFLPAMNQVRDLRNADGSLNLLTVGSMANHVFWAGAQSPNHDYTFPNGAALLIPANSSFDMNSHYVNRGTATVMGEVYTNLYTIPKEKVTNVVRVLDLSNTNISIASGARTTLTKDFVFDAPRTVIALTSHMHKTGEKFVIKIKGGTRDGEVVYETTDWEHPTMVNFETPIVLKKGEGLTSIITYNNTTKNTVRFGLTSEDEMGIIFGYYY